MSSTQLDPRRRPRALPTSTGFSSPSFVKRKQHMFTTLNTFSPSMSYLHEQSFSRFGYDLTFQSQPSFSSVIACRPCGNLALDRFPLWKLGRRPISGNLALDRFPLRKLGRRPISLWKLGREQELRGLNTPAQRPISLAETWPPAVTLRTKHSWLQKSLLILNSELPLHRAFQLGSVFVFRVYADDFSIRRKNRTTLPRPRTRATLLSYKSLDNDLLPRGPAPAPDPTGDRPRQLPTIARPSGFRDHMFQTAYPAASPHLFL
jgi:hypothetical protein